ncbi:Synaptotagmin-3 [Orchesella cincta]|uniref:Synaptotagmin-3 n=1 Tax=Orchesella cincta TaxID=48709 RepID=A0A1D2NBN5_ORCCI|nr:Synaptotagmin-3 [Orchesella cincta]
MVSSAVLGAAVGTGLALVVAMTILLYHYYVVRRKNKDWGDLERFEAPYRSSYSSTSCLTRSKRASVQSEGYGRYYPSTSQLASSSSAAVASTSSAARSSLSKDSVNSGSRASVNSPKGSGSGRIKRWDSRGSRSSTKSCPPMYTYPQQEFNVDQEQRIVQPLESSFASLPEVREISSSELSSVASPSIITTTKAAVHIPSGFVAGTPNAFLFHHPPPVATSVIPVTSASGGIISGVFGSSIITTRATPVVSGIPPPLPLPPSRRGSESSYTEMLTHQSRSLPTGPPIPGARINRTPSVSSQGQNIENFVRKGHRGSSPAIRTFTPEGLSSGVSPPDSPPPQYLGSRSPSPLHMRGTSYDKNGSPNSSISDVRISPLADSKTPSHSQSSLTSLSDKPLVQSRRASRCLSPLLIPPKSPTPSDSSNNSPAPLSPLLGTLQLDLYQRKDMTVFLPKDKQPGSSPHDKNAPLGRIHFRLRYDLDKSDLHVHVIEAHDLAGSSQGGFNDPYIRLYMSPEVDTRKRQTSIHRNESNPYFDEHFKFPVSQDDLKEKILILQVFDYDRFSRNDVVGQVSMRLEDFIVTSNLEIWAEVVKSKTPSGERQEVLVSLSYLPSAERLTVVLLKARNLYSPPNKDTLDPYVKVYMIGSGKRLKKKKTTARKNTNNPVWNEAVSFSISPSALATGAVEICVLDQSNDLMGTSSIIGSCILGPRESGSELAHWQEMSQNFRKSIAMWHVLT